MASRPFPGYADINPERKDTILMNTHAQTQAIGADVSQLATDVYALVHATADVAGEKIGGIRQRIRDALDHEMALYGRVRNKALHGTHAADDAMHRHPYPAVAVGIGVGVGLGAAFGYLLNHWWTNPGNDVAGK